MKNKKSGMSGGKMLAVGASVAAVGAGAYYLMGPHSKAHQKKAKELGAKMEKEISAKVKQAKEATIPVYHKVVDAVSASYAKQYKAHEGDIKAYAQKLKKEWKGAKNTTKSGAKKAVHAAKSQTKKAVRRLKK